MQLSFPSPHQGLGPLSAPVLSRKMSGNVELYCHFNEINNRRSLRGWPVVGENYIVPYVAGISAADLAKV